VRPRFTRSSGTSARLASCSTSACGRSRGLSPGLEKRFKSIGPLDRVRSRVALDAAVARAQRRCTDSELAQFRAGAGQRSLATVAGGTGAPDASGYAPTRRLDDWGKQDAQMESDLDEVIRLFSRARQVQETQVEASVRQAFLLLQRGRASVALQALDQLPDVDGAGSDRGSLPWCSPDPTRGTSAVTSCVGTRPRGDGCSERGRDASRDFVGSPTVSVTRQFVAAS